MAARADSGRPELVSLRHLRSSDLEALLTEETNYWREHLRWDFSASADLVGRYLDMAALPGFALWTGKRVAGYCYYVIDDQKALIGDLFLSESLADPIREQQLLEAALREVAETSGIRRIESQVMMMRYPLDPEAITRRSLRLHAERFLRFFMVSRQIRLPSRERSGDGFEIRPWTTAWQEDTARLVADCYEQHIDSQINDQYRSVAGARRFLSNIVLYPGCGEFAESASFAAIDHRDGALLGVVLSSRVGPEAGHLTQVCVAPHQQGRGIGRRLIECSLAALTRTGCAEVSLTVTAENRAAVSLYQRLGFVVERPFTAYVWHR